MHPKKEAYSKEVFNLVREFCNRITKDKENSILIVLKIAPSDAQSIIDKIMLALPDRFFYSSNSTVLYEILGFIVKNYIFFQAQQNYEDDIYVYDLMNFIRSLTAEIQSHYFLH